MANITNALDVLDALVEEIVAPSRVVASSEVALITTYYGLWAELKKRVCTSSGWTGVSEYLLFRYILRYIEDRAGYSFVSQVRTRNTYVFRCGNVVLTRDVQLAEDGRPDVALLVERDGREHLIAAFEVKIYIASPKVLDQDIEKCEQRSRRADPILVLFLMQERLSDEATRKLGEFRARGPKRRFLVGQSSAIQTTPLDAVLDKILKRLSAEGALPTRTAR